MTAKPKKARHTMPGPHTVGASFPADRMIVLPAKPKAKKVRKQWCMVMTCKRERDAKFWERVIRKIFPGAPRSTIRYLPVGRARKGKT